MDERELVNVHCELSKTVTEIEDDKNFDLIEEILFLIVGQRGRYHTSTQ
jgi:hypothetical protein